MASAGRTGTWVAVILLVIAAALGGFYAGRPDLFGRFVDAIRGAGVPELAESHFKAGYFDLRRDSYAAIDAAIASFEKAVAIAERYAEARAGLAEAHLARAEWMSEEAADLAIKAAKAPLRRKTLLEARAMKLRAAAARHREGAFRHGREALRLNPRGLLPNRALADYYRLTGAREQMRELLDRARQIATRDAGSFYVLGSDAAGRAAAQAQAMRYFEKALVEDPKMQRARFKLAALSFQREEHDEAKLLLERILSAVPGHERARALLDRMGEAPPPPPPKAKPPENEERSLEEDSGPPTFSRLYHRAERLRRADRSLKALALYERALEMEPEDIDTMMGLGWCHLDLEQPTSALGLFHRVQAREPRLAEVHMGLAEAYRQRGMKRDAIKHYQIYLDITPYGDEAAVARRMIKELYQ